MLNIEGLFSRYRSIPERCPLSIGNANGKRVFAEPRDFMIENRGTRELPEEPRTGTEDRMQTTLCRKPPCGWAILLAAAALALAGCSLDTAYRKEKGTPSSDTVTRMGEAAWRIELSGYVTNSRQKVLSTLMRRCAEVTVQAGYDYFVITGGEVVGENDPQPSPLSTFAPEGSSAGQDGGPVRVSQRYHGTALFQAFKGKKPADNPLAFDAREFLP
jgi:hypothetical protein